MKLYLDISNYIKTRSNTGIQRVIKEFLIRLISNPQEFNYKILFYNEEKNYFNVLHCNELKEFLFNIKNYSFKKNNIKLLDSFEKGSYFFDMDAIWHDTLKRDSFYPKLKKQDVIIVNFIYDLAPIVVPQFTHKQSQKKFIVYLDSIFQHSDFVFFDSRSAEEDFLQIKKTKKIQRNISTSIVKLGSDISLLNSNTLKKHILSVKPFIDKKYILFVGTLEPRKNHALMLNVFEALAQKYTELSLVFIGKLGWDSKHLAKQIRSHHLLNQQLYWLDNIDDSTLVLLYKSAFLVVYLSEHEGFGLPIAESLKYGNITITSKNSSMYEVGKNYADYLIYNTVNELYEIISIYYQNDILYDKKRVYIKSNYKPYTWDMTYNTIIQTFNNFTNSNQLMKANIMESLQFVFISIDYENLTGTIASLEKYVPFIKEYIVITHTSLIKKFQTIPTQYKLIVIDENKILGVYADGFAQRDHQSKNWLLRASLTKLKILDDEFIMLDDDNRPLKNIDINFFITQNRQYNAYYFYNLLHWHEFTSEYDTGQHTTKCILDNEGLELLSYSSHMPQIINKQIWNEVIQKYFDIGLKKPLDEWSIYFNYAISNYPSLFNKKVFETMNWPANSNSWEFEYLPVKYTFENYYSDEQFSRKNLSYKDKIKIKEIEIIPYLQTKTLMLEAKKLCSKNNAIHGQMQFKKDNIYCILSNIPYFIVGKQGTFIKLPVNFKILNNTKNKNIFFYYTINGDIGHKIKLPQNYTLDDYTENILNIPIWCPHNKLEKKSYNLLFDLEIDNQSVYANSSPYLVKLFVEI